MSLHIRWRIALPYIFLILFIMIMTSIFLASNFRQQSLEKLEERVTTETSLLAEYLSQYQGEFSEENATFDELASTWAEILDARITIISPDGTVLGDPRLQIHDG